MEVSFLAVYNMRLGDYLRTATWREFMTLVNNLPSSSPLVERLVSRMREGPEVETPEDAWSVIRQAWGI